VDLQRPYYLVLGDLKRSTQPAGKIAPVAINRLIQAVSQVSQTYAADLVLPMEVNYGDEFAGLFHTPARIYDVIDHLRDALRGATEFRVAIAYDHIGNAADTMRQMGGPAFQTANDALLELKKRDAFCTWHVASALEDQTLTVLANAADGLRQAMTDYQYEVFRLLGSGMSQIDIARRLEKFEQSISTAAKRGQADLALALDLTLRQRLKALQEGALGHADGSV